MGSVSELINTKTFKDLYAICIFKTHKEFLTSELIAGIASFNFEKGIEIKIPCVATEKQLKKRLKTGKFCNRCLNYLGSHNLLCPESPWAEKNWK